MKKVILVTDGDELAQKAVLQACLNTGLYPIMKSGGNPTPISGSEISQAIRRAPANRVVVMLDDRGKAGNGRGEKALEHLLNDRGIEILGVVAVASDTKAAAGVEVDESVDKNGRIFHRPVDKDGEPEPAGHHYLEGDTAEILARYPHVRVVGCGDLGKMKGRDDPREGAVITTRCLQELLKPGN